jgi:hypothetical protein
MHAMQIFPLLRRGFKRQIQPDDIPSVPRDLEASSAFEVGVFYWGGLPNAQVVIP